MRGKGILAVAASDGCSAAISSEGRLYTWGSGLAGQLGHGHVFSITEPKPINVFDSLGLKIVQVGGLEVEWQRVCSTLGVYRNMETYTVL